MFDNFLMVDYLGFSDSFHYLKKETDIEDIYLFLGYIKRFEREMFILGD